MEIHWEISDGVELEVRDKVKSEVFESPNPLIDCKLDSRPKFLHRARIIDGENVVRA